MASSKMFSSEMGTGINRSIFPVVGAALGDYDNDGDIVYSFEHDDLPSLLRNDGGQQTKMDQD